MDRITEVGIKHDRIRKYLFSKNLDGVLLSSVGNFAWATAGGDSHVENHNKFGIASLLVTQGKKYILTNNIEAERLLKEEIKGAESEFELVISKWFDVTESEKNLKKLTKGSKVASEIKTDGCGLLASDFQTLRYQLTESEVERYRWLGKKCGRAIEGVARKIQPGMTEYEIEAEMAKALSKENILPVVLLVAGDERNYLYRHPIPKENQFTRYAKLVCCARKWGLIAALTRSVYVGEIPQIIAERQEKVAYIDSVFISETKPGREAREIFLRAEKAYEESGFPGEWQFHHQGGGIGYDSREFLATEESTEIVENYQAFAWNPSICETKSEDTILVNDDGYEIITESVDWPMIKVDFGEKINMRPAILQIN